MATQGIELPVSLQLKNLQEIANQIKSFANKNVLADSLGGKKVDSELAKILSRLEQISAKSKTAFTTQSDFTSIQKDIGQVELSLNKVHETIKNLGFEDLKIPSEFSGQISALQGRIKELNGSLAAFKGTQKEKLVNNVDFMADLQAADPKQAAKWLEKGYDELYKTINEGMTRVNMALALKAAEFENQQKTITQNTQGKTSMTQWGALQFIQDAFKTLPNDDKQRNTAQEWISKFMKESEDGKEFSGFSKGAQGMNGFLKSIKEKFSFTDEQMAEMRARIKQQVQALRDAGEKEATAATVVKSMGHNEGLAKQILFGDGANNIELSAKKYATQIRDAEKMLQEKTQLEGRAEAFGRVQVAFDIPNKEIEQKAAEIAAALKIPEEALKGFEAQVLSAATKSPQLALMFQQATGEIANLTNTVEQGKQKLQSIDNTINKMQGISNFINRYVGLYAIVRKVTTAIRNAFNNIKELDKAITGIAVVTNMSQEDLWSKIGEYTAMAQQYGVATKDVYEVSQIFYQQGLQTAQVMSMTTESLKMAKIAGIDYTTAANAMTVAVRAFKLEMTEAQSVTDTYSALAAKFAVSSSEIANAMEKTASSAASVGMSLQSTSAFISVMEQTTRESAQNIGSALKSIISRYGEMKASPDKLLNVDGEEVAFNKVDTALASIGISIKDVSGQFRDFDDVIMELASKWDSLDNNTQRYIATIMAGNRQQSRFIALVSNYDELSRAMDVASNAENASIVQVAKTMDSLESKANQLKNAFSQIYLDLHAEEGLKNVYDWLTRILKTIGKLGVIKGVLPTLANIIGFGTGAKSLLKGGMNWLQDKKGKWQIKTDETEAELQRIREEAQKDINTKWKIQADLSELNLQKASLTTELEAAKAQQITSGDSAYKAYLAVAGEGAVSRERFDQAVITNGGKNLLNIDENITPETRDAQNQMAAYQEATNKVTVLSNSLGELNSVINGLKNSSDQASNSLNQAGESGQRASNDLDNLSVSTSNSSTAENNHTNSVLDDAQAAYDAAKAARDKAQADLNAAREVVSNAQAQNKVMTGAAVEAAKARLRSAEADRVAAEKALQKAQADTEGENAERREADASNKVADANFREVHAKDTKASTGLSLTNWGSGNALKYAGVATGIARLAGTAITAVGAAHEDKIGESFLGYNGTNGNGVEVSKMLTGIGNGLSMAGTGASMGMALGPWGAALGAIGGFLISGLNTIIDGATMTLEERLEIEKEETKRAADESLKAQAKATDLSGQIDNIKKLQEVMYNSTEDMQAYKDAMNSMSSQYPQLISSYDEAGNAIIDLNNAEVLLAQTRADASRAAQNAARLEAKTKNTLIDVLENAQKELLKIDQNELFKEAVSGKVQTKRFEEVNKILEKNATELNIAPLTGAPQGLEYIYSLMGWDNKHKLSRVDYSEIKKELELRQENYQILVDAFNESLPIYDAQDALDNVLINASNTEAAMKISESNTAAKLIANFLELEAQKKSGINSAGEWALSSGSLQASYTKTKEEATDIVVSWLTNLSDDALDSTLAAFNSMTNYISVEDMLKSLGYDNSNSFIEKNADLLGGVENAQALINSWQQSFLDANEANRNRILEIVYTTDKETGERTFNTKALNSLYKVNGKERIGYDMIKQSPMFQSGEELAEGIASKFETDESGASLIVSKYADYFASQLVAINNLAKDGYTELAGTRLDVLNAFANQLSNMNSDMQNDMFGIITNIDFSSYNSIKSALDNMNEYAKNNGIEDITKDAKLGPLYESLQQAADSLIYNVNTLAQELTTTIINASKKIDSIIATNKSGLTFDKALEEFAALQTQFSEITRFDQVFSYDAALSKYVYKEEGLAKAIEAEEQYLEDQATKLADTAAIYTEKLTKNGKSVLNRTGNKTIFTKSDEIMELVRQNVTDNSLLPYYNNLAADFLKNTDKKYSSKDWDTYLQYLEDQAVSNKQAAEAAELLKNESQANKKNQYYGAIDWAKLALGTDYTGINQFNKKALVKELNKERGIYDQISEDASWDFVLDAYLEKAYEGMDNAKELIAEAKARIKGEIETSASTQATTAISEILAGPGKKLSDETKAVIEEWDSKGEVFKISETGELESATEESLDYVKAALIIYKDRVARGIIATIEEQNKSYVEIINASFAKANVGKTLLSSGNNLDMNTIESSFTTLGIELDDYYKEMEDGSFAWTDGLENILETDIFGQTKIRDWEGFKTFLTSKGVDVANATDAELAKWRRTYVNGVVSDMDETQNAVASQLNALSSAKVGEHINISDLPSDITSKLSAIEGITVENGWLMAATEQALNSGILALEDLLSDDEWLASASPIEVSAIRSIVSGAKTKFNKVDTLTAAINEKVTYSAAESLAQAFNTSKTTDAFMQDLGFYWDNITKQFVASSQAAEKIQAEIDKLAASGANAEVVNNLTALKRNLEDTQKYKPMEAIRDILQNYNKITNEMIAAFETEFTGIDIDAFITTSITGEKEVNIALLRETLEEAGYEISNLFGEEISSIIDVYLSSISDATGLINTGTVQSQDMFNFVKKYNDILGTNKSVSDLFNWNDIAEAWTLDPTVLNEYVYAQAEELVKVGILKKEDVEKYLNTTVRQTLAGEIDIGAFLDAENKNATGKAYATLKAQLSNYLKAFGEKNAEALANSYIKQIKQGGAEAVAIMQAVAEAQGTELSASDVEAAYRIQVNELELALDQLTYGVGSIISGEAIDILQAADYGVQRIEGSNTAVITSIGDVATAYLEYYKALVDSGEATLGALNEAYAKVLETKDGRGIEQSAIDALGDASGMTYTRFAEIFTEAGIELTDDIMSQLTVDGVIEALGGNKMRINDFTKFAQAMNWDFNSEEYTSAFKSYNDGLIELNRKAENDIVEEINKIGEAKAGDWINVTTLSQKLSNTLIKHILEDGTEHYATALYDLNKEIALYGGNIKDGILKLSDNANLLQIAKSIESTAKKANLDLKDGFEEIADTIESIFNSYVEAIRKGIKGGLNNVEKSDLIAKASDLGVDNLTFEKTIEGLKLSQESAIELYNALKEVDELQASLVFDDLRESLEKTNDNFKSTSALLAHVQKIRNGTYATDGKTSPARLKQYQEELSVAEEILATRSATEDSSFAFMNNKIPAGQQNPLTYMENWAQAYEKMKATQTGGKNQRGLMEYQDFYNIVTEMGNIAELMGGEGIRLGKETLHNSEEAANLITRAAGALKVTSDGKMKVDLSGIGVEFKTGAEQMSADINKGIDAVADSQIAMLDSLIAMLEVVVAMEQLGDIDVDNNNTLDLSEIFTVTGEGAVEDNLDLINGYTDKFEDARKKLINYLNEVGNEGAKSMFQSAMVNFGGGWMSMYDALDKSFKDVFGNIPQEDLAEAAKTFQGVLNSFYQAALSNDYDLEDLVPSVKENLRNAGVDLSNFILNIPDKDGVITRTITFMGETMIDIDYSNDDVRKKVNDLVDKEWQSKDKNEYQQKVQQALEELKSGKDKDGNVIEDKELFKRRTFIGLASQEFILDTETKDDKGNLTGYYDGKQFKGSQEDILSQMTQAAMFKDFGGEFIVDTDKDSGKTSVRGKKTISGTEVELILEDGKVKYKYGGNIYDESQYNDMLGHIAEDGGLTDDTGIYSYTDDKGKKKIIEVKQDTQLKLNYTYYIDDDGKEHFKYNGHDFDSFDKMHDYMSLLKEYDPTGKRGHEEFDQNGEFKEGTITINDNAKIKYTINADGTIEPEYIIDGHEIKNKKAFDAYVKASQEEAFQDLGTTKNENLDSIKHVKYQYNGQTIDVEINLNTGTTLYSYSDKDFSVSGNNPDIIKAAIAAHCKIEDSDITGNGTTKITVYGQEIEVEIKDGKISLTDKSKKDLEDSNNSTLQEKINEFIASMNEKASENPQEIKATASSIEVTLADGATATIAGEDPKIPMDKLTLSPSEIAINPESLQAANLGEQIAEAIQNYLNGHPFDILINPKVGNSEPNPTNTSNDTSSKLTNLPRITEAIATPFSKIDPKKAEATVSATQKFDPSKAEAIQKAIESTPSGKYEDIAEAITNTQDDKVFAATEAINTVAPATLIDTLNAINEVSTEGVDSALSALESALDVIKTAADAINNTDSGEIEAAAAAISGATVPELSGSLNIAYNFGGGAATGTIGNLSRAKGNIALSKGTTSTLMGELGPELVVSNGRYFLAGQNGAEFVDLANDAIVFNHLQTKRLMQQGAISGRGQAFTNERAATSFAAGNVGPALGIGNAIANMFKGAFNQVSITALAMQMASKMLKSVQFFASPEGETFSPIIEPGAAGARGNVHGGFAMASASAALAALKQLRAMWESLKSATAKDLAGLGGSGGGGGGGNKVKDAVFIKELEIWYNWLQKIAELEEKINYEEAKRNRISSSFNPNGKDYVQSQKESLDNLKEEVATHQALVESQQEYFKERQKQLNNSSPFSALYTFDDQGQLKYKDGALDKLSKISGRDATGKPNLTAAQQYNEILKLNPEFAKYMEYDSSGNKIDKSQEGWEAQAVQAFWDKIEADQKEMQGLHDSIEEHKKAVLEKQQQMNEIMHEMEDNQINLENKVLNAIEESRQREIDALQDERDAIEDAANKVISGLQDQLDAERDMYERQQSADELSQLQRQLAILERSGAAASQIDSIRSQIQEKQQDIYFDKQQEQIDALQEAVDTQLEKLDEQIKLMTETLEYEKEHGLLWNQVYAVMAKSPQEISDYIKQNNSEYWGKSPTELTQTIRQDLFEAEQYKAMAETVGSIEKLIKQYSEQATQKAAEKEIKKAEKEKKKSSSGSGSGSSGGSGSPTESGSSSTTGGSGTASTANEPEYWKNVGEVSGWKQDSARHWKEQRQNSNKGATRVIKLEEALHTASNWQYGAPGRWDKVCTVCGYRMASTYTQPNAPAKPSPNVRVNETVTGAKDRASRPMPEMMGKGGLVKRPTMAIVGETGSPEAVLNPEQTRILRENILSNKPSSLITLLKTYNEGYSNIGDAAKSIQSNTNNAVIIERAEVHMEVKKIANDYDAKRAGDMALEQIMKVARKTQANNRVGR